MSKGVEIFTVDIARLQREGLISRAILMTLDSSLFYWEAMASDMKVTAGAQVGPLRVKALSCQYNCRTSTGAMIFDEGRSLLASSP
jgi:hypothetical protein